ncbi:hypothetical protein CU664_22000 [Pseudomonas syringae pv. actinidifoliorum]|uniref:DUF4123 domain-containing protein n=1 Tax=Pseudomonas syringae TaxID=317 RepID=UPI001372E3A8|nr:DUF4123 domain-containing protein [Pseudomonas syringae]NAS98539.1 hypothetical protein [Pseudomonas syringae pv. actinidifoliorum]NAT65760.1 hypothetical protein [Pseudomonas syringae pv. actinidifoliorum]
MTTPIQWQEKIEHVCTHMGIQQVDLLLDQAGWGHCAVPALKMLTPKVSWFSLFTGTPEQNLLDQAPLLMRLDLTQWRHKAWLEQLVEHATDGRLMVVISSWPFEVLSKALQGFSQLAWGKQTGLLRYYDSRIFPLLMSSILTDQQRAEFMQVASYWGWLDRDNQPQWLQGTGQLHQNNIQVSPFVELNDQQFDQIGCISDAQQLLNDESFDFLGKSQEQRFGLFYSLAVQAGQENHVGDLAKYVQQKLNGTVDPV